MLYQLTIDKLQQLRLSGMAKALEEQRNSGPYDRLSFEPESSFWSFL
jgi:hypothetical protein